MDPIQKMTPMSALNLMASIAEGNMRLPFISQASTLLIQKEISGHNKHPETNNGGGLHQLILVEAQQVFSITEQDFNVPVSGNMLEQGYGISLQVTRCPIAHGLERTIQVIAGNHELAGIEFADACPNLCWPKTPVRSKRQLTCGHKFPIALLKDGRNVHGY